MLNQNYWTRRENIYKTPILKIKRLITFICNYDANNCYCLYEKPLQPLKLYLSNAEGISGGIKWVHKYEFSIQ